MYNGGFLDARRTNPVGLGLVIAGHAAVLTAIALAPPDAVQRITYVKTIVGSIVDKAPPPPDMPPSAPRPEQRSSPSRPVPIVDSQLGNGPIIFNPPTLPRVGPPPIPPIQADPVVVPATIDPGAMARFQPDYPPELIRAEIEGSATVRVLVGSDGRVRTVELVSATQPGFFEATRRQALRFWKFRPAASDGAPIESWRTMTVRFKIQR